MKIAMIGYGKMGRTIERLANEQGHEVVLKINADNLETFTAENLKQADVAIEFSQPEVAYSNIMTCLKAGLPVVSGTTAWLDQYQEVSDWCKTNNGAFFYASNFSIGVNIFFELNKHLAQIMSTHQEYQVEMEEIHHTQKLDAPSGTAVTLAEGILEKIDSLQGYQLQEENKKIANNCIPITAKRIGNTPGTHVIQYHSAIDELEIKHTAKGREGFASGAILAAQWLIDKKGVFGMNDLLQLS
ncbi:4-hydroxy-tetrahydrodipicolinate reductase [Aureispira anguillae]|uniref:4-hydroxy-tetrahydrodipicolinate reductase n=1 Tax=Aureispira anguillae TaxID=2864201 RepID=A0A915VKM0_9BACT|nr:4-hydroxy-tetrahydrodipicolinate reductase [Aureispira anguillae]BDS09695.1 4-hydroxy-tetrahydrodipicolinate reductase [Aureispira anguillae]